MTKRLHVLGGCLCLILWSILACGTPTSTPKNPSPNTPTVDMSGADLSGGDMTPLDMAVDMVPDASGDASDDMPTGDMDMASTSGEPLNAALKAWTWVDFPESACGNGQPTGIGVNLSEDSKDVLVFVQGGGACWDVNTCFVLKSAAHLESGYTSESFDNEAARKALLFDRTNPNNPFKDASYIFVPYCTGDLHNGDRVKSYMALGQTKQIHHRGAHNMKTFLSRIAPTFTGARAVYLSGASAGGYGVQFNYERFVGAMPEAEVHLMADSSPLVQPYDGRWGAMRAAWDFQSKPECAECDTRLYAWASHLAKTYPDRRFGLLAYDTDEVIRVYFGYPIDPTPYTNRLKLLIRDHYTPYNNAHVFIRPGTKHVMLGAPAGIKHGDVTLLEWLTWWRSGEARWVSLE